MKNKMGNGAAGLAGAGQSQRDQGHEADFETAQPVSDDEVELVGDLGNDADDCGNDEDFLREINRIVSSPQLWRRFGPVLRALDRHRYVLAAARVRELRIAAIETAMAKRKKLESDPMAEPNWHELWEASDREAERRSRAYVADECDPATPEANPEIAEWEAHWPSAEPASEEPRIEIVIRGLKRMTRRK